MTNEEAIKELKEYEDGLDLEYATPFDKAILYAIKALSQEPTVTSTDEPMTMVYPTIVCEDAISRQAVKDILNNSYSLTDAEHRVEQLPSVTQNPETVTEFADRCRECGKMRKGHWIYDETIENWRCSKCNETPKTMGYVGTADFMAEHFKFCNHCGAKMESEE